MEHHRAGTTFAAFGWEECHLKGHTLCSTESLGMQRLLIKQLDLVTCSPKYPSKSSMKNVLHVFISWVHVCVKTPFRVNPASSVKTMLVAKVSLRGNHRQKKRNVLADQVDLGLVFVHGRSKPAACGGFSKQEGTNFYVSGFCPTFPKLPLLSQG